MDTVSASSKDSDHLSEAVEGLDLSTEEEASSNGSVEDKTSDDWKDAKKATKKPKQPGLKIFKRFSLGRKRESTEDTALQEVTVKSLPQKFITKYLGTKRTDGLWGIEAVRGPLEELVQDLRELPKDGDLPLMILTVTNKGMDLQMHKANKSKLDSPWTPPCHIPVEFISYGVQDIKYSRVFTFIEVKEMSARTRITECSAFLCDSVVSARKMALSLSKSFQDYTDKLQGRPFRFQVDLRSAKEIEEELSKSKEEEC